MPKSEAESFGIKRNPAIRAPRIYLSEEEIIRIMRKEAAIKKKIGNLIDRVRLGYVVDMLDCTFIEFPVFNVADCFVVCGTIAALVYYIWIYPNTDAKNWEKDHGTDPAQGK